MTAKLCAFFCVLSLVLACKKPAGAPPEPTGPVTSQELNQWVCDSMKRYAYYSNELNLSVDKNQDPKMYFTAIKSANDRFSYLELPEGSTSQALSCRSKFGFDYVLFKEPTTNKMLGLITMVMTSNLNSTLLKRGDYFNKINNIELTENNSSQISSTILTNDSFSIQLVSLQNGSISPQATKVIAQRITPKQELYNTYLYTGSKKIGYLYLSAFENAEVASYVSVLSNMKYDGINELILDFRHNAGGDVSAAATLCAVLTKSITATSVFIKYKGNTLYPERTDTFDAAMKLGTGPKFSELSSMNLNLTRVYILTTKSTASAAELVINNLKPYLNVIQIGETTRGKDEASTRISDKRKTKRIDYILHPIVYKVFNASGVGNYPNGLSPKYSFLETEHLPLGIIGKADEPMIANCLLRIAGILPSYLPSPTSTQNTIKYYSTHEDSNYLNITPYYQ